MNTDPGGEKNIKGCFVGAEKSFMIGDDYSTVKFNSSIALDSLFAEKDTNDVPVKKKKLPLTGGNKETTLKEGGTLSRSSYMQVVYRIEYIIFCLFAYSIVSCSVAFVHKF